MSIVSRFRSSSILNSALGVLAFVICIGCSQHYCPTYASTSYNQGFTYKPEKSMAYKPVKVHEFDKKKMVKSSKKDKPKSVIR